MQLENEKNADILILFSLIGGEIKQSNIYPYANFLSYVNNQGGGVIHQYLKEELCDYVNKIINKISVSQEHENIFNKYYKMFVEFSSTDILEYIKNFLKSYENDILNFTSHCYNNRTFENNYSIDNKTIVNTVEIEHLVQSILILENKEINNLNITGYNDFSENDGEFYFESLKNNLNFKARILHFLLYFNPDNSKIKVYKNKRPEDVEENDYIVFNHNQILLKNKDIDKTEKIIKLKDFSYLFKVKYSKETYVLNQESEIFDATITKKVFYSNVKKVDIIKKYKQKGVEFGSIDDLYYQKQIMKSISDPVYCLFDEIPKMEEVPKFIFDSLELKEEDQVFFVFLEDFFSEKDIFSFSILKSLLNIEELETGLKMFNHQKSKLENTEILYILKEQSLLNKMFSNPEKYIYSLQGFMLPDDIKAKDVMKNYLSCKQKLNILFFDFFGDKYSSKAIFDFIDLFYIFSLYHNVDLNNIYFNINIIKEMDLYIKFIEVLNKKNKTENDVKYLSKNIKDFTFLNLNNYIENENKIINDFVNSIPKAYQFGFKDFLNEKSGQRINKLFIFLEGYTSFLISNFIEEDDFKKLISLEDLKENTSRKMDSITFGKWKNLFVKMNKNRFLDKSSLDNNKFLILQDIITEFHKLRNDLRGHGCFFNYHNNNLELLEHYFFKNIDRLININEDIKQMDLENFFMYKSKYSVGNTGYFDNNSNLILTLKSLHIKNGYPEISFFNYSNPNERDDYDVNVSEYLHYLGVEQLSLLAKKELNSKYLEKHNNFCFSKNDFFKDYFKIDILFDFNIGDNNEYLSDKVCFTIKNILPENNYEGVISNLINNNFNDIKWSKGKLGFYNLETSFYLERNISMFNKKREDNIISAIIGKISELECFLNINSMEDAINYQNTLVRNSFGVSLDLKREVQSSYQIAVRDSRPK